MKIRAHALYHAYLGLLSVLLTACAALQPPPPTPTMTPVPSSTPEPRLSYRQIASTWSASDTLASMHLERDGMTCESCHPGAIPDTPVERPPDDACLACHGPTVEDLIRATNVDEVDRPHPPDHLGDISCSFCHEAHETSPSDPCTVCH